jgi:hypothetical protein
VPPPPFTSFYFFYFFYFFVSTLMLGCRKGLCEREMAAWPCHQAFIGLAAEALLAAHRRAAALGERVDPGAGLWPQPFSWRAFFRCEALHPWPEDR